MRTTTTALACLLVLLTGCSGGADHSTSSKGTSASSTKAGATKAVDPPPPLMLGTQRYASPCRLLTPDDVTRIYGDPGEYGSFHQEYQDKSIPVAQMKSIGQTYGGAVDTVCNYSFDDTAKTSVNVSVDQYPTPQAALSHWKDLRRLGTHIESRQLAHQPAWAWLRELVKENEHDLGGVGVRGLDPSILFVAGHTWFVGVRHNLVITVEHKSYARSYFEPKLLKDAVRTTRAVFATIYQHADDATLPQTPADPWWSQSPGWPEFLDPCTVFDDTIMATLTGHPSEGPQSDSVLRHPDTRLERNHEPGDKAVENECTRYSSLKLPKRTENWDADAQLVYGAPGDSGSALLDGYVLRKLYRTQGAAKYTIDDLLKTKALRRVDIKGADGAYIFHYQYSPTMSLDWIMANVGRYVVVFDAHMTKPNGYDFVSLPDAARLAAVTSIVANIKKETQ